VDQHGPSTSSFIATPAATMPEPEYQRLVRTAGRDCGRDDPKLATVAHGGGATRIGWQPAWARSLTVVLRRDAEMQTPVGAPQLYATDRDGRGWTAIAPTNHGYMIGLDIPTPVIPGPEHFYRGCLDSRYVPTYWMRCSTDLSYLWFASTDYKVEPEVCEWYQRGAAHGHFAFAMVPFSGPSPAVFLTEERTEHKAAVPATGNDAVSAEPSASQQPATEMQERKHEMGAPLAAAEGSAAIVSDDEDAEHDWTEARKTPASLSLE